MPAEIEYHLTLYSAAVGDKDCISQETALMALWLAVFGIVRRGNVAVGVNTGGVGRKRARLVREQVEELLGGWRVKLVVGSRESKLAVVQANMVIDFLRAAHPGADVELATFKTTGDKILDRRLDRIGGKGLFVKELDAALRAGECDFTVHSCKDLPMEVPDDLPLVCFSAREDPRDVLVFPQGAAEPDWSLPIGTSSRRREVQLKALFPQATFASVRGNLQTRLRKLDEGGFGALVLAAAGLKRMGLEDRIGRYLEPDEVIPSAGQGVLAVQGRAGCSPELFEGFADEQAACAVAAERAFVARLEGGCSSPIAAHARFDGGLVEVLGLYYDEEAKEARRGHARGNAADAVQRAAGLADDLRKGV